MNNYYKDKEFIPTDGGLMVRPKRNRWERAIEILAHLGVVALLLALLWAVGIALKAIINAVELVIH